MTTRSRPTVRSAFIDTSAYFALTDVSDNEHDQARDVAAQLSRQRWRTFTTNFILAETHALLLNRLNRTVALRTLQAIESSGTIIERVSVADERRAREILVQYDDKTFSLTDTTSFAVMERLGIQYVFAFDRDFTQYGLNVLTPEHLSQR
ncbi:MAG: PIN domain-containing protein [Dehalococcoidia bacterium]|nr:PIN domain-containing protein [Dehalococcoidia bacterium]